MEKGETHYYIYWKRRPEDHRWTYERTCGSKARAEQRVKELFEWYKCADALYTVNQVIKDAWY